MRLDRAQKFSRLGLEHEFNPIGEFEVQYLALRLDGVYDLAHQSLRNEFWGELAGNDDDGLGALRRSPTLLRRRAHDHVTLLDHHFTATGERNGRLAIQVDRRQQSGCVGLQECVTRLGQVLAESWTESLEVR